METLNDEILEETMVEDTELDGKAVEVTEVEDVEFDVEDTDAIYFILTDEKEIVSILDSKTDEENCVLSPFEAIDYSVLGKLFVDGEIVEKELSDDEKKSEAIRNLGSLCDKKSVEAKSYINGSYVSVEQLARYEEKYQSALSYKADGSSEEILKLEAELQGLSVADFADVVIRKGEAYKLALATFNAKIEAFRIKVNKLIEAKEFEKVSNIFEKAEHLDADATDDDVKSLFI